MLSIHQPHLFPWYGYINKIASSDIFVLLDHCQFSKGSKMNRQTLLCNNGSLKYITLPIMKTGLLEIPYKDIVLSSESWKSTCEQFIINNYKGYPYFEEVWNEIAYIFELNDRNLFSIVNESILCILRLLDIKTKIVYQSELNLNREFKNNDMLVEICIKTNSNHYISGNGAKKYMELNKFNEKGITVSFQRFTYPSYEKYISHDETNISILDILFNIGIENTKKCVENDSMMSRLYYLEEVK